MNFKLMKNYASFLFFFCLLSYGQIPRDTIRESRLEKERESEALKKCNELKDDFKNISFKKLEKRIVDEIILDSTKENIIINYRPPFSRHRIIFVNPFADADTPVYCNYTNPGYNQSDFWNKRTVRYLHRKFKVNIIPFLPIKEKFINIQNVKFNVDKNDKAISVFLKQKKIEISGHINANEGEKYHFFNARGYKEKKLNLSKLSYQELKIEFSNYLNKIITVRFIYNEADVIIKTYQYQNKKWIEISTKEEYKF